MTTSFSGGRSRSTQREPPTIQQYFSYIMATSFSGGGSRSTRREPPTMTSNWYTLSLAAASRVHPFSVLVVEEAGVPGENHRPWALTDKLYYLRL